MRLALRFDPNRLMKQHCVHIFVYNTNCKTMCEPLGFSLNSLTQLLFIIESNANFDIESSSEGHDYTDTVSLNKPSYIMSTLNYLSNEARKPQKSSILTIKRGNAKKLFKIVFSGYCYAKPEIIDIPAYLESDSEFDLNSVFLEIANFSKCNTDESFPWPYVLELRIKSNFNDPIDSIDSQPIARPITFEVKLFRDPIHSKSACNILVSYTYTNEVDAVTNFMQLASQYGMDISKRPSKDYELSKILDCEVYTIRYKIISGNRYEEVDLETVENYFAEGLAMIPQVTGYDI